MSETRDSQLPQYDDDTSELLYLASGGTMGAKQLQEHEQQQAAEFRTQILASAMGESAVKPESETAKSDEAVA